MENINSGNLREKSLGKWFNVSILVFSIIGFADSLYLTIKYYFNSTINCSIFEGCDLVTMSDYSAILGVPVAIFGMIFYVSIFIFGFLYLRSKKKGLIVSLFGLASIGFLISMWLVYVQAFILKTFCFYCLISALLSTILFILSIIMMIKYKNLERLNFNLKNYETNS